MENPGTFSENDYIWHYCMTTFDSEWEVGKDSVLGLSFSELTASTKDLPMDQPQPGPEAIFGFGHGFGRGFG